MAVKKISISLDAEVLERAKRAASAEGVALSTWLSHAAEEAAVMAEAREALAEPYSPPTPTTSSVLPTLPSTRCVYWPYDQITGSPTSRNALTWSLR